MCDRGGVTESTRYNEEVFKNNLRFGILEQLASPPHGFQDVVQAHFYIRRHTLVKVCRPHIISDFLFSGSFFCCGIKVLNHYWFLNNLLHCSWGPENIRIHYNIGKTSNCFLRDLE